MKLRRCVVIILVLAVAAWLARPAIRAWLSREPSRGPLFAEWAASDWGYGWDRCPDWCHDASGTWVYDDHRANMVVVQVTEDADSGQPSCILKDNSARLFVGSRHSVSISRVPDTLTVIDASGGQQVFPLRQGVASTVRVMLCDSTGLPVVERLKEVAEQLTSQSADVTLLLERMNGAAP